MQVAPIDLRPFREGSASQRRTVAAAFDRAGCESGFFAVTGHGTDEALLDAMLDVTGRYFDQPIEAKLAHVVYFAADVWPASRTTSGPRGWRTGTRSRPWPSRL